MYDYIKGTIAELTPARAVIEAAGVGYDLAISLGTYADLESRTEARLFVHFIVREDAQLLYGFSTREERTLFRHLLSVPGVGGNTARTVLSTFAPDELRGIIATGNAALLKSVKGLGLKTAQKIIVELGGRMAAIPAATEGTPAVAGAYNEALSALGMLGFARPASEKALRAVFHERPECTVEEAVRSALRRM